MVAGNSLVGVEDLVGSLAGSPEVDPAGSPEEDPAGSNFDSLWLS